MRLEHALTIALISTLGLVGCGPLPVLRGGANGKQGQYECCCSRSSVDHC
ncbi:hypothetical protein LCGC14_2019820 [marine sediment metagenome]|uniref:Uncharacterized protein n=1 Tax=marine sediment metagenome TaxID=412755 RepID=A0A0F9HUZ5_9ZZZZ